MVKIIRFEDIHAWQTARKLTDHIYQISGKGDFKSDFGLRDQIRQAAVSVMSNIAESFESQTQAMFIRFLGIAKASAGEVRSQLYTAMDLDYLAISEFNDLSRLAIKVSGQIYQFSKYLKSKPNIRRTTENSDNNY